MMERQGKAWSQEEERRLEQAFLRGATIEDLARELQRSSRAVRVRLERRGLLNPAPVESKPQQSPPVHTETPLLEGPLDTASLETAIDHLVAALLGLKVATVGSQRFRRAVAEVTRAYDRVDSRLLSTVSPSGPEHPDESDHDPAPDRFRAVLLKAVSACVSNLENRRVANLTLGLVGDGDAITLAAIGRELGVSRQRAHQRRVRAFLSINASLRRQFGAVERIRRVLKDLSATTDWTNPSEAAPYVLKLLNTDFSAATQLTLLCCKAAGAVDPDLAQAAENAVAKACRDPDLYGRWTIDRWADAAGKALFHRSARFQSPPQELIGLKRLPGNHFEPDAPHFRSNKLNRTVSCESPMESRVLRWLERSSQVLWYQEQPTFLPYFLDGQKHDYYPDAAVWDTEHRIVIVEAKPAYYMYRRETLIKALAALDYFGPQGIGYLLVDGAGRTLRDLADTPFDASAAEEIESLFIEGPAPFRAVRAALTRRSHRFDSAAFTSMVVNRDWAVSTKLPVHVWKLPGGVSFGPLLKPASSHVSSSDPRMNT